MNEWINEKLLPPVLKFVNTKSNYCLTERDALHDAFYHCWFRVSSISEFPVTAISEWVNASGLAVLFQSSIWCIFCDYVVICGHRYCLLICKSEDLKDSQRYDCHGGFHFVYVI